MGIQAFASLKASQPLEAYNYEPAPLGDHDVHIDIQHCGICHSDISMINNEWDMSEYPLVPGHEVVGKVTACGKHVSRHQIGDIVGVGWQANSCGACHACEQHSENNCGQRQETIVGQHGGFAEAMRANEQFAIGIPKSFDLSKVGPMMCGGVTAFSPFVTNDVRPGMNVGIIGIGGLGHFGVQFANAFGCEVTAFTTSTNKTEAIKQLGAHHVVDSREADALAELAGTFDFILSTANADLDWAGYTNALRTYGTLCLVGVPNQPIMLDAFALVDGEKKLTGGSIGSPDRLYQMLAFSEMHNINSVTEHYALNNVNEAIAHADSGKVQFRTILDI